MNANVGNPLRKWRLEKGLSLEDACGLFKERGFHNVSTAKLSRIERDQKVPIDFIPAVEAITGIPAKEQRPDLVKILDSEVVSQ
jgi:hypothetical protein